MGFDFRVLQVQGSGDGVHPCSIRSMPSHGFVGSGIRVMGLLFQIWGSNVGVHLGTHFSGFDPCRIDLMPSYWFEGLGVSVYWCSGSGSR